MIQEQKNKKQNFFKWFASKVKQIPWYGWVGCAISLLLFPTIYYFIAKLIINSWSHSWMFKPRIDYLDNHIPFCPYFFIQIYFLSYGFWIVGSLINSLKSKENYINYFITCSIAFTLSFFILIFAPTYIDRCEEGLINSDGSIGIKISSLKGGFTKFCMKFCVLSDGGKLNLNCFPSFHCLFSALIYLFVAGKKEFHLGVRISHLVWALLITMSTLFIKQHYFVDILGGWLIAFACYLAVNIFNPGKAILNKNPNFLVLKNKKNKNEQN